MASTTSPISGSRDFLSLKLSEKEIALLESARDEGIKRGVTLLSKMTCDYESVIWGGISSVTSFGVSFDAGTSYGKIASLLTWAFDKAVSKISRNIWFQRFTNVLKIGTDAAIQIAGKILLSSTVVSSLLPFANTISGIKDSVLNMYDMAMANSSLNRIERAAPQIGSGIPTVMFDNFKQYLSDETLYNAGKAVYNFSKTLINVLVSIFAAPASSLIGLVDQVVSTVTSFVYMIYQAYVFKETTGKCRDWVKYGDVNRELDFSQGIAACPFIGCVFFGAANYIGHFNLTSLLTRSDVLSSANLTLAVSEVSAVQKEACKYVVSTDIPFKFIDQSDEWILKMMRGMAESAPRSEFVSKNASMKVKFKHYGKLNLGRFKRGFGKIIRKL